MKRRPDAIKGDAAGAIQVAARLTKQGLGMVHVRVGSQPSRLLNPTEARTAAAALLLSAEAAETDEFLHRFAGTLDPHGQRSDLLRQLAHRARNHS